MTEVNSTDYLAAYDAAADADKYPLVQKRMKTEPLPFFKQLRAERPILVTPECTLLAFATCSPPSQRIRLCSDLRSRY